MVAVFSNGGSKKAAPAHIAKAERTNIRMNSIGSWLKPITLFTAICCAGGMPPNSMNTAAASDAPDKQMMLAEHNPNLTGFQVVEFRRYLVKPEERQHFAQYFEAYFPEAFQQLGAIAAGSFFERKNRSGFTWIRGFHTIDDRAIVNAAFYYGPVWNEHRSTLNVLMTDSDNVLLLRPLSTAQEISILPAVDPVTEPNGAQGVVVAQVFAVKTGSVEAFADAAKPTFGKYRNAGAREAGILVTLDVRNNFPQLPVRTDGPYLVWLGILRDNQTLEKEFTPVADDAKTALTATGLLRDTPELIVLDPTPRSRLRWLPR